MPEFLLLVYNLLVVILINITYRIFLTELPILVELAAKEIFLVILNTDLEFLLQSIEHSFQDANPALRKKSKKERFRNFDKQRNMKVFTY